MIKFSRVKKVAMDKPLPDSLATAFLLNTVRVAFEGTLTGQQSRLVDQKTVWNLISHMTNWCDQHCEQSYGVKQTSVDECLFHFYLETDRQQFEQFLRIFSSSPVAI
jgi:hypothetical protein